jgi:hypothetical protein
MNKNFTFKIGACFTGDVIYLLQGIKNVCEKHNVKAEIYIWLDRPVQAPYPGANHPYNGVALNRYALDMLKPLLESQPYVAFVKEWAGQPIAIDLDELRTKVIAPMPYGSITRWAGYAWPDMQCDTSNPWINLDHLGNTEQSVHMFGVRISAKDKILINRTSRYQNPQAHYWFLREYEHDLLFIGLPAEHEAFCKEWELNNLKHLEIINFLELAFAMISCKYFIGNQSFCFALAEAMKIPRLLEVCNYAPNVIPCGKNGYDFMHQFALEWFVKNEESPLSKI